MRHEQIGTADAPGSPRACSPPLAAATQVQVLAGDKQRGFVGSKEWIGAVELSYVLDELLGVTCKIVSVTSGSEIEGRAADLIAHFQQQVMLVLAGRCRSCCACSHCAGVHGRPGHGRQRRVADC